MKTPNASESPAVRHNHTTATSAHPAYVPDYSDSPVAGGNEGFVPIIPPVKSPSSAPASASRKKGSSFAFVAALTFVAAAAAGGYFYWTHSTQTPTTATAAPAAPPAPQVNVQTIAEQRFRLWNEFSGRLQAVDFAQVRPEVSGRITEVRFEDGQTVAAGNVLFVIDPRPYEDAVARAQARVSSAKASIEYTQSEQKRTEILIKAKAIAQRDFDQAASSDRMAQAALEVAEAELKQAQLDLDHAYVKAPISGRASRAEITVGNVVQSGPGAPVLTSIASKDGIYADFEVDEQTYLETIRNAASGNEQERRIPVQLIVGGDTSRPIEGRIWTFDNRLNIASGTIRARAKFDNTDGVLVPGMFVTVRLAGSREQTALLVPERSIGSDQNKKYVFVLGDGNAAQYREVQLGKAIREQRVIATGLQIGDRVIVDGVQHVRPGATVQPNEVKATPVAGTIPDAPVALATPGH